MKSRPIFHLPMHLPAVIPSIIPTVINGPLSISTASNLVQSIGSKMTPLTLAQLYRSMFSHSIPFPLLIATTGMRFGINYFLNSFEKEETEIETINKIQTIEEQIHSIEEHSEEFYDQFITLQIESVQLFTQMEEEMYFFNQNQQLIEKRKDTFQNTLQ